MTTTAIFEKDADSILDYKFDWAPLTNGSSGGTSDWLDTANSETISNYTVSVSPDVTGGVAIDTDAATDTDTSVTVWLSGGVAGTTYYVTCQITTSSSRTDERTISVKVIGITNGYATLAEVKSLDILDFSDNSHDSTLEREISAASRKIDEFCGRTFYNVTSATARYFTPEKYDELKIDDIYSTTDMVVKFDTNRDATYDLTLAATDWDLWPYNPKNGRPWVKLLMTYVNGYSFYLIPKSVEITALWGWASVPPEVNQACVMIANRLHKRNQTILGVAGATAVGQISLRIPKLDPDVQELLLPLRKSLT